MSEIDQEEVGDGEDTVIEGVGKLANGIPRRLFAPRGDFEEEGAEERESRDPQVEIQIPKWGGRQGDSRKVHVKAR